METTPLINYADARDENQQWINYYHDDSSSGYDSTDTWDIESVSSRDSDGQSVSSCDIERDFARSGEISAVVMKVCSPIGICESLQLILEMPEMCDVTFLVGPEETPVHGLKAVLSARSRVFHQLILEHLRVRNGKKEKKSSKSKRGRRETVTMERLQIPVKRYDAEVFRMLIQFIHSGTAYITVENVSGLLCGAVQFELSDLSDACWEFIDNCLKEGKGQSLIEPTRAYSHHQAAPPIFDKIYKVLDERFICPYKKLTRKESSV